MSSEVMYPTTSQRTPCVLVLDASGSMDEPSGSGRTRIAEMNNGVQVLKQELMSDSTAKARVELCIVCVGGPAGDADLLMDWSDVSGFMPPNLSAGGMTHLGAGMHIAMNQVEQRKQFYKANGFDYTRPWIIVISDGEPTDQPADWQSACQMSVNASSGKRVSIFPVGVDSGANLMVLGQLTQERPAVAMNSVKFSEFFLWLSKSLSERSRNAPGQQVMLAPVNSWAAVD